MYAIDTLPRAKRVCSHPCSRGHRHMKPDATNQTHLPALLLIAALLATPGWAAEPSKPARRTSVPDLQGTWTGAILTPLERPKQFADIRAFKPEELAEQQRQASERFLAAGHRPGEVGRDNDAFLVGTMKILPDGRTSLISQPADGLLP